MTEQPGVTTPVTDRPLTAEDVALLREALADAKLRADQTGRMAREEALHMALPTDIDGYTDRKLDFSTVSVGYRNLRTILSAASRPPSVSADPVGGVTSGAGEGSEAARIIACHLPVPEAPDSVCIPVTLTAGDLRTIYAALTPREEAPANTGACPCGLKADDCHPDCPHGSEEAPAEGAGERCVMVCPQCEGEGEYADGVDEAACSAPCTRCEGNGWLVDLASLRARTSEPEAGEAVTSEGVRVRPINVMDGRTLVHIEDDETGEALFSIPLKHRAYADLLWDATHPSPATADKLRESTAKISSELEFIKIIASNLKDDIDRMEVGFTKSQKSRGTERVMLEVRQRSDTLIQCATDALATLSPKEEGGA